MFAESTARENPTIVEAVAKISMFGSVANFCKSTAKLSDYVTVCLTHGHATGVEMHEKLSQLTARSW